MRAGDGVVRVQWQRTAMAGGTRRHRESNMAKNHELLLFDCFNEFRDKFIILYAFINPCS